MRYFARLSPIRAYKDLRSFLLQRQPYELVFLAAAVFVTTFFIYGFMRDSHVEQAYKPDIIYVEQYRLDRTDAEIIAQQKIDGAAKEKLLAEQRKRDAERQASFKRLDDKLKKYGF